MAAANSIDVGRAPIVAPRNTTTMLSNKGSLRSDINSVRKELAPKDNTNEDVGQVVGDAERTRRVIGLPVASGRPPRQAHREARQWLGPGVRPKTGPHAREREISGHSYTLALGCGGRKPILRSSARSTCDHQDRLQRRTSGTEHETRAQSVRPWPTHLQAECCKKKHPRPGRPPPPPLGRPPIRGSGANPRSAQP